MCYVNSNSERDNVNESGVECNNLGDVLVSYDDDVVKDLNDVQGSIVV